MKMKNMGKDMNMKRLFRRNQIIITTLAIMIAAAGYLNYAGKQELAAGSQVYEAGMMEISDEDLLEENMAAAGEDDLMEIASLDQDLDQLEEQASAETAADAAKDAAAQDAGSSQVEEAVPEEELAKAEDSASQTGLENPGEAVLTSGMNVTEYIAGVQLSREQIRAKNKESLMSIINNTNIEEAAKQQAIQDMITMTEIAEKENAAETLLMAKGFADPVVSITNDKVDVVVNAASITDPQRAQIEDIVKRKTEAAAENIIITLLNLEE